MARPLCFCGANLWHLCCVFAVTTCRSLVFFSVFCRWADVWRFLFPGHNLRKRGEWRDQGHSLERAGGLSLKRQSGWNVTVVFFQFGAVFQGPSEKRGEAKTQKLGDDPGAGYGVVLQVMLEIFNLYG